MRKNIKTGVEKEKFASDTSSRSVKDWAKALFILIIGLTVAHLGVTLFLLSGMGSDTFTVFIEGLSEVVNLSIGTVHVIVLCVMTVIMFFTTKGYIKPGTIVCAFCGGPIIDIFSVLFGDILNENSHIGFRITGIVVGCTVLSLGMSVVISSNAGTGPNDLVAVILSDKINFIRFQWVRMICDFVFVLLGFVLGGTVGVGTVIAVFLTGPLVQFWLPITKTAVRRILHE